MATEFIAPPTWLLPDRDPLNTKPGDTANGAEYKPVWNPVQPLRQITAESNNQGQAGFVVRFKDRARFEAQSLGTTSYTAPNRYLTRQLPIKHGGLQDETLFLRMLQEEKHFDPSGEGKKVQDEDDGPDCVQWGAMGATLYRGYFAQAPYDFLSDEDADGYTIPELQRYLIRTFTDEIYHRRVASWSFVYADEPTKIAPVLGSLPEHVQRWTYRSLRWPWSNNGSTPIPIGVIGATGGKVNVSVFDPQVILQLPTGSPLNGFPAGQLYYESYELVGPYRGADSALYVDYVNHFLWNPNGWNKTYKSGSTPPYVSVHEQGHADRPPYLSAEFDNLYLPRGAV